MKKTVGALSTLVLLLGLVAPTHAWNGRGGPHGHGQGNAGWWWYTGAVVGGVALGAAVASAPRPHHAPPAVVVPPATVYVVPPPPAPIRRVVLYPHGRYLLYGDGVTRPYRWVWIAAGPVPPPPPPPPFVR